MMKWCSKLCRKKSYSIGTSENLHRALSTTDLIFLGLGSTLGVGIYVLSGQTAKEKAGPAVTLSFLIAAVASLLSGLCYAEYGARIPKAGSAYVYSYVTIGELVAFVIGWNLVLEYMIGVSSVGRAFSGFIDYLTKNAISTALTSAVPINASFLSSYFDVIALLVVFTVAVVLSLGVKLSSQFNTILTVINLTIVIFVTVVGSFKADIRNWHINVTDIPLNVTHPGVGGYMPFGFQGVLAGAATCFYGFVGFDIIATTGEEARNPEKSIPLAILVSLSIVFLCYLSVSMVTTLMWPYYDQDVYAPLVKVFQNTGLSFAVWIIVVGTVCALLASLLGSLFPLPRILYAMSEDGIIFEIFSKVHSRFRTPLISTLMCGVAAGLMAAVFDLTQLMDMMSLGTLMAYSIVSLCVLILRYQSSNQLVLKDSVFNYSLKCLLKQSLNVGNLSEPTFLSSFLGMGATILYCILLFPTLIVLIYAGNLLGSNVWLSVYFAVNILVMLLCFLVLVRQPKSVSPGFKTPFVPLLPICSLFMNVFLILNLTIATWLRFLVWMTIGFSIYFSYGVQHSKADRETSAIGFGRAESPKMDKLTTLETSDDEYTKLVALKK